MGLNTKWTLRTESRRTGHNGRSGESNQQSGEDIDGAGSAADQIGQHTDAAGSAAMMHSDNNPIADNDDPMKVRIISRGKTKWRRRLDFIKQIYKTFKAYYKELVNPKLSRDEKFIMLYRFRKWDEENLDKYRLEKEKTRIYKFHKPQARKAGRIIIDVLTNLGYCDMQMKDSRRVIKKRIRFTLTEVGQFAYVYHLDRLPFGVKATAMGSDEVCTELAQSLGHKVRYDLDLSGLRYTVEIGSTLSIPNFVGFGDIDDKQPIPKNLPTLGFWAGLGHNGKPVYKNLADAPHMIIAGSSGGGKSNMENAITCMFLRNTPDKVRMIFFDLKGGIEFSQYAGLPHLLPLENKSGWSNQGIIEYPVDVLPALDAIFAECMSRLTRLKNANVKKLSEYNRGKRPKDRWPYIVIFFDEWASTKKLVGNEAENKLSNIANLSRSAGIHFVLATQYPKAEIINTAISVNFPWRMAFNMGSGASQSVLGNWDAFGLSPTGRAVLQTNENSTQVQTPRITNSNIKQITEKARTGVDTGSLENLDDMDVLEWALDNAQGNLTFEQLFNHFRDRIHRLQLIDLLKNMDNKTFDVNGAYYKVIPGKLNIPRRMILETEQGIEDTNTEIRNAKHGESE